MGIYVCLNLIYQDSLLKWWPLVERQFYLWSISLHYKLPFSFLGYEDILPMLPLSLLPMLAFILLKGISNLRNNSQNSLQYRYKLTFSNRVPTREIAFVYILCMRSLPFSGAQDSLHEDLSSLYFHSYSVW